MRLPQPKQFHLFQEWEKLLMAAFIRLFSKGDLQSADTFLFLGRARGPGPGAER